ncbi:hydrogenase 4 subunit B [bacterium]|nr:hydrogenase 4 subunit B [bacterium]NCT21044.1 hydrogenase 4 subunit B [bacterium]OIO83328.1 MAG: hydrogenase 4 subunit B [Anaerolineae bacterium CG2_30_57_67]
MQTLFLLMFSAYAFGVVSALLGGQSRLGRNLVALGAALGAGAGFALGVSVLVSGAPFALSIPQLLPLAGGLALRLDSLGAFFLILIGIGAVPAAIYGAGYSEAYADGKASLPLLGAALNLFLLTMSLVTFADNALTFLLMWEGMSLTSYFLVVTEAQEDGVVGAGVWYVAMTHVGLVLLLGAFILFMNGASGAFADLRAGAASLSPLTRSLVFLLAFLGFGSKAGIVPLHVWLPMAHPAAPSHVSALMSGVMIKMGVYGILRVGLDLLGGGPAWWGGIILSVGALSAILGILYALMQTDLKKLLAYSSVENIGIILIGIGAGFIFHSYGLMTLAALGFIGGLYHALNHASFKGLLFLGAGSVLHATHTRDMEMMGGLIKKMPYTAFFFLVGAAAISALPPLNGFASEWLILQSLLGGFSISAPGIRVLLPVAVGMLALTSGLAAAGFVKAFGITFLALPRSAAAEHAHEAPLSMKVGMGILALTCFGLGLAPFAIVPVIGGALNGIGGLPDTRAAFTLNVSLQTPAGFGQMSSTLILLGLLALFALIPLVMKILRVNPKLRVSDSWGCGRVGQTPRMEYTATSFAEPLRRVFSELYRPTKEVTIDFNPESKYFVQSIDYKSDIRPWFEEFLYEPLLQKVRGWSRQVRQLQSGSLHGYLAYLFIALGLLLVSALLWTGK